MDGQSTPKETEMDNQINKEDLIEKIKEIAEKLRISDEKYISTMEMVKEQVTSMGSDFTPMIMILTEEEKMVLISLPAIDLNNTEAKFELLDKIGSKLQEEHLMPVLMVMASECWLSRYEGGVIPENAPPPSQDPNKQEKVMIIGLSIDGRAVMCLADITRSWDDKPEIGVFGEIMKGGTSDLLAQIYISYFTKFKEKLLGTLQNHSVSLN
jgi:hypothetical protein